MWEVPDAKNGKFPDGVGAIQVLGTRWQPKQRAETQDTVVEG
jgi:hypothetical protein